MAAALAGHRGKIALSPWGWFRTLMARDLGGTSLRRALRVAIVVPPLADPPVPPTVAEQARARIEATHRAYDQAPLRPAGPARRALLTLAIGTSSVGLWITLPVAAFLAAYVPTVVSFLVGQAAFTLFVVVLFDLLQPEGWRLGLIRLEDRRRRGGPGRRGLRRVPDGTGLAGAADGDLGADRRSRQRRPAGRRRDGGDGPARLPDRRVPAVAATARSPWGR